MPELVHCSVRKRAGGQPKTVKTTEKVAPTAYNRSNTKHQGVQLALQDSKLWGFQANRFQPKV